MSQNNVGASKLAIGLLQSLDIESNIMSAITVVDDTNNANSQIQAIKNLITGIDTNLTILNLKAQKTGKAIIDEALMQAKQDIPLFTDYARTSANWRKLGWSIAAAMNDHKAKIMAQQHFLDTNLSILYDMPENIIKQRAQEYWLSIYRPVNPSDSIIINQTNRGNMTRDKAYNFLSDKGYSNELQTWLFDNAENYPSVREMVLASQFTPITDIELTNAMKYSNITTAANKAFYLNYAHSLQLRDEFNQFLQYLRAAYIDGLVSDATLSQQVAAHKPNANESAKIIANAKYLYSMQLLRLEVQAQTSLYRTKVYDELGAQQEKSGEDYFYNMLVSQGVQAAMANAIVRYEAAKRGINYERD